jgi:hypothetical protein
MGQLMDLWSIMLHSKHGNLIGVLEGFVGWVATLAIVVVDFSNGYSSKLNNILYCALVCYNSYNTNLHKSNQQQLLFSLHSSS